jgi:hypothetical protein
MASEVAAAAVALAPSITVARDEVAPGVARPWPASPALSPPWPDGVRVAAMVGVRVTGRVAVGVVP